MDVARLDEEKLREAACYGDLDAVRALVKKGVNVNSQHNINGWTALHWAAKRNHLDIAHFLLLNDADPNTHSFSKEVPADLTTSPAILNLFGSPGVNSNAVSQEMAISPHYLTSSPLPCRLDTPQAVASILYQEETKNNQKEVVLKVRIAHSTDEDFIEVEIFKSDLTFSKLVEVCCSELGITPKYVERLRKLPNTRLRKDKDVQRLADFQEIEVVLVGSKAKTKAKSEPVPANIVGPAIPNQTILY